MDQVQDRAVIQLAQRFERVEIGGLGASGQEPLLAHIQLVFHNEFGELGVAEPIGRRFLHAQGECLAKAGQAQLFESGFQGQ